MQLGKLFEGKSLWGKPGLYPFTPENLLRVGLALCAYLRINREVEKPRMTLEELNFLTLSLSAGFMAGGGDVCLGYEEGDIQVKTGRREESMSLSIEGLEDYELRMVESLIFSRYNMPRAEGEEVGAIWIRGARR
ncbi:MAG: hypothetical protein N2648_04645 [Aquificaceae bacterium]|nr:hypothetical protein [Aquificaceae bacterium]